MEKENRLILEYQSSQSSAEHYDSMIWTMVSLGVAFSLIILYKVAVEQIPILVKLNMLFIGVFVLFYFGYLIETANEKKLWKYYFCKRIEKENNFIGHNKRVDLLDLSNIEIMFNQKFGIGTLRFMRILLFVLYLALVIVNIVLMLQTENLGNSISIVMIISSICVFLAILGSITMEIFYIMHKQDLNSVWEKESK